MRKPRPNTNDCPLTFRLTLKTNNPKQIFKYSPPSGKKGYSLTATCPDTKIFMQIR